MSCSVTHEETLAFIVYPFLLPFSSVDRKNKNKKTDQLGKRGRNWYKDVRKKVNETYPLIICTRSRLRGARRLITRGVCHSCHATT